MKIVFTIQSNSQFMYVMSGACKVSQTLSINIIKLNPVTVMSRERQLDIKHHMKSVATSVSC